MFDEDALNKIIQEWEEYDGDQKKREEVAFDGLDGKKGFRPSQFKGKRKKTRKRN